MPDVQGQRAVRHVIINRDYCKSPVRRLRYGDEMSRTDPVAKQTGLFGVSFWCELHQKLEPGGLPDGDMRCAGTQ